MGNSNRTAVTESSGADSNDSYRWSSKTLEELATFYADEIEPALRRAGHPPDERPSYQTLADAGFSGLAYALREHHDMTVREFLVDEVGFEASGGDGYDWEIDDETTRDELAAYCDHLQNRKGRADETVRTTRTRLARYARVYESVHGAADFVSRVDDRDNQPDEIKRNLAVFDTLKEELGSDTSKLKYLAAVDRFYGHLLRRHRAAFNPVADFEDEYDWSREQRDNPALSPKQVQALLDVTDTGQDELLVYALCAWGLRRKEVAELHVSQFQVDGEDPTIHFDERKNGAGQVSLLYGRDVAADRIALLGGRSDWTGHLFPSTDGETGHISPSTIYRRFRALADRADVRVRGETPSPQMGRRFWYESYSEAMEDVLEMLDPVAADQGSADSEVVARSYLSGDRRRELRREKMRERLAEAFEVSE